MLYLNSKEPSQINLKEERNIEIIKCITAWYHVLLNVKFLPNMLLQSQGRPIAFSFASLPFQQVSLSLIPALLILLSVQ